MVSGLTVVVVWVGSAEVPVPATQVKLVGLEPVTAVGRKPAGQAFEMV